MKDLFKRLGFVIVFGVGVWMGITYGICYFFHLTDFDVVFTAVGIAYAISLIAIAIAGTKI